jgi:uncharacterized membrane protein YphA (DoxX/SURF4 family)
MFIYGGYQAATSPGNRVKSVEKVGLPRPEELVRANGAAMVLGGAMLALGIKPKLAAFLLSLCLIPTTLVGHQFWEQESEQAKSAQLVQFFKNTSMLGALVLIISEERRHSRA